MTEQQNIQVEADNVTLKGAYANNALISHTKEEFVLDFMLVHPPKGLLVNRNIVSPAHFKRMVKAMQENLSKYESQFGAIAEASGVDPHEVGFKA